MKTRWPLPPETDWELNKGYPDHREPSIDRWAWEFLARNQKFKEAVKALPRPGPTEDLKDPSSPFRLALSKMLYEFGSGMGTPLLPAWGFDRPISFERWPRATVAVRLKGDEREWFLEPVADAKLVLAFDLRLSIKKQLSRAEWMLRYQVKAQGVKPLRGAQRIRRTDYRMMLRVLDARAAGVKQSVIANVLFPRMDSGAAVQKIKRLEADAKALSDSGYRYLGTADSTSIKRTLKAHR